MQGEDDQFAFGETNSSLRNQFRKGRPEDSGTLDLMTWAREDNTREVWQDLGNLGTDEKGLDSVKRKQ